MAWNSLELDFFVVGVPTELIAIHEAESTDSSKALRSTLVEKKTAGIPGTPASLLVTRLPPTIIVDV